MNVSKNPHFYLVLLIALFLHEFSDGVTAAPCPVLENDVIQAERITKAFQNGPCVTIKNVKIVGKLDFPQQFESFHAENAIFTEPLDAYLANGQKFHFQDCRFEAEVNFHSFKASYIWLNGSVFDEDVIFVAMEVEDLNLVDVKFRKSVDFSGAVIGRLNEPRLRSNQPIQISWSQFGERWLQESLIWALAPVDDKDQQSRLQQIETSLRFWKRNFTALGQQRDANEANYEIIELKRQYFTSPFHADWWAITLTGLPSRQGTRPYRPLWIGLLLILIFAVIYRVISPFVPENEKSQMPNTPLSVFSLLYSLDTFVPIVEISGVRKWGWQILPKYRWLTVTERILGLVVSSLAAYSIGSVIL